MNNKWTKTVEVLKEILKILYCSQCNENLCKSDQVQNCGHFYCISCLHDNTKCLSCCQDNDKPSCSNETTFKKIIEACCTIAQEVGFDRQSTNDVENKNVQETLPSESPKVEINDKKIKKFTKRKGKRKTSTNSNLANKKLKTAFVIPKAIDKRNHLGETKLQQECKKGHLDYVKALLEANANPNLGCFAGWTPLQEAADFGFLHIAEVLLKYRAEVDKPGHLDRTPLQEAISSQHFEMVDLLLKHKADKNLLDNEGKLAIEKYLNQKEGKNLKSTECDNQESCNTLIIVPDKVSDQTEGKSLRSREVKKQENVSQLNSKVKNSGDQKESKSPKSKKTNTEGSSNNLRKNNNSKVIKKQKSMDDFIYRTEKNIAPKENLVLKRESSNNEECEIIFEKVNNTDNNPRITSVESITKKEFNGTDAIFNSNNFKKTESDTGQSLVSKINLEKISFNEDSPVTSSQSIGSLNDLDSEDIIDVVN